MQHDRKFNIEEIGPEAVLALLEARAVLLVDVREPHEFEAEHIAGAVLLPLSRFEPELFPLIAGRQVVLHCAIGKRSLAAARMLRAAGHERVTHMEGGLKAWKEAGLETELPLEAPDDAGHGQRAPTPGTVLTRDYLAPAGLTGDALAAAIGVPAATISALLEGALAVNPELSLRLARYFSTEPDFWMQLQLAHDLHETRARLGARIDREIARKAA